MSPATIQFPSPADNAAGWEAAGRQIAPMLGSYSAAVVTSSDPLAAAHAAIGIGLAEAEHRRVAIGDLVGEVEPIQSLVSSDDPHGISDSFTFGVSLNKIATPIDTTGNLFIMPSGTGSVSDPEIFRNTRWQRLANGFREVGALLILVAPADAPGLKDLIDQMDGVVLVGQTPLDFTPYINVLARIPAPLKSVTRPEPTKPLPIWKIAALLLILVALVGAGVYWRYSAAAEQARPRPVFRQPAPKPAPAPADTIAVPPPVNPADSVIASAYGVELAAWNAPDDAMQELTANRAQLPAATVSPVPVGPQRETYYKVVSGAYPTRNEADALLASLRHRRVVQAGLGTVVRTPYALLVDSATAGRPFELINKYAHTNQLRQYLYVLAQRDGSMKVYAGAFERPEDAATLLSTLRAANLSPVLAYRTGRAP